jgi:hypothetical protein
MEPAETIAVFDSQGEAYQAAFQKFLEHTDQKDQARRWLDRLVESLSERRVFIDAGAGNGKVTTWFVDRFERTIAIEPNPHLREQLARVCGAAQVVPDGILDARPAAQGDLVLCSHVFYYIDRSAWMETLGALASWAAPHGALAVVIQNHESDCMRMLEHFYQRRFNLVELADAFRDSMGRQYRVELETTPAVVRTRDFAAAAAVAEFMLNLLPLHPGGASGEAKGALPPPRRADVASYIRQHFADGDGGYRFSCDQDFLLVRPRD